MEINYRKYNAYYSTTEREFEIKGSPIELLAFIKGLDNSELVEKKLVQILGQAKISFKEELDKALQLNLERSKDEV